MRLSGFQTGEWTRAYDAFEPQLTDLAQGGVQGADGRIARQWFAYHLLDAVFDPTDPALSAEDILSRATRQVDPERWVPALARYHRQSFASLKGEAA